MRITIIDDIVTTEQEERIRAWLERPVEEETPANDDDMYYRVSARDADGRISSGPWKKLDGESEKKHGPTVQCAKCDGFYLSPPHELICKTCHHSALRHAVDVTKVREALDQAEWLRDKMDHIMISGDTYVTIKAVCSLLRAALGEEK